MNLTCAQWLEQNQPAPGQPVDAAAMAAACGVGLNQAQRKIHQLGYFHKGSKPHYRTLAEVEQKRRDSQVAPAEAPGFDPGAATPVSSAPGPLPAEASQAAPPLPSGQQVRKAPSQRKKKPSWFSSIVDRAFGIFGLQVVRKKPVRRPKQPA